MMYNVVIIEDEFNAQEALKKMLKLLYPSIEIVGVFPSIQKGVNYLKTSPSIDLIFLDIELEDGNSFELLQQLTDINFKIIFTTGMDTYAIDAIKHNALDYLLKPIDPLELKSAADKAFHQINETKKAREILSKFEEDQKVKQQKLIVKTSDNTYFIDAETIIMFESEGAYTKITCLDQTILASKNLKHFECMEELQSFIRVHHSFLVNPKHIINLSKSKVDLSNGHEAKISVRKYGQVVQKLNENKVLV
ncbi:response regulator transcription factor [Flammeovirga sp. MY04]|uniref:LytR/AlgR family response regulator transcription factor n=1 Tax=Flammeovirga sp. MY04 TaxID=1191459 RepID=UPI0009FF6187|nr:LytTR family DNA-binding domain-containing protein [Flammeovirga sp. MY04]ANQ52346.2 response regulator transcription factor [Flammeovirga sp. MY04]